MAKQLPNGRDKVRSALLSYIAGNFNESSDICDGDGKIIAQMVAQRAFGAVVSVVNPEKGAQMIDEARKTAHTMNTMFNYDPYR